MEIDHGWLALAITAICVMAFFLIMALINKSCDSKDQPIGKMSLAMGGVCLLVFGCVTYVGVKGYKKVVRKYYPYEVVTTNSNPQEGYNTAPPQRNYSDVTQGGISNPFMAM